MFLFYVLSFFKNGDTIQGGTLYKGGHYLRKYGIYIVLNFDQKMLSFKTRITRLFFGQINVTIFVFIF